MDLMRIISETPALQGTFVEDLFGVMQDGSVADVPEQLEPGEQIVGEMNELEKALHYLRSWHADQGKLIHARLQEIHKKVACGDVELNPQETADIERQLAHHIGCCQAADKLLWANIEKRLVEKDDPKSIGWGIRAGHKIVLRFDDENQDLGAKGFGRPSIIVVIGGERTQF